MTRQLRYCGVLLAGGLSLGSCQYGSSTEQGPDHVQRAIEWSAPLPHGLDASVTLADFNGDGLDDLLVGAHGNDDGGKAYLVLSGL